MASIKRDDNKQQWENTEFPLVCETCLGDNPYIRMTKEPHGKKCTVCEIPFTVFAWQAGTKGRLKKVEICKNCALTKNVCQVCIYDLQYGLPVAIRDKVLAEHGGSSCVVSPPQSDANLSWFASSQQRAIENGTSGTVVPAMASVKLKQMARMEPRYERNLPKLCSFYARGECDRGMKCPFRHEMPKDRNDPLSKQNTRDRYYGTRDPVADKMMAKIKAKEEEDEEDDGDAGGGPRRTGTSGGSSTNATLYIRFDPSPDGTTHSQIDETCLRDHFYSYGEITSIRFPKSSPDSGAFIEYTSRNATELAISSTKQITINNRKCHVSWARTTKRGQQPSHDTSNSSNATTTSINAYLPATKPLTPPGSYNNNPSSGNAAQRLGFMPVRPPADVVAVAHDLKKSAGATRMLGVPRPGGGPSSLGVPRPGGGVMRRVGPNAARGPAPKPYYPSQDPGRLGSRA